ncbi:MAG: helix-turn-helix domain-containing protein [Candidatus Saccharimonadia bacterium]
MNEQRFLDEVGKRLASARKSKSISQEELSAISGLDRVAIGYIEQGRRRPTLTTVYRLARGLDVRLADLFRGF